MRKKNNKAAPFFIILIIVFFTMTMFFIVKIRPIIKVLAVNQAEYIANKSINESVEKALQSEKFSELVLIDKDKDDKITAVKTNMPAINVLKTNVTMSLYNTLNEFENLEISVPFGAVISSDFFANMGPKIPIKLISLGTATSEFKSEFSAAGINQTRHNITLHINADIKILFPFGNENININSQFIVMETILMGNVPNSYTYIEDDTSSKLGKINDYSDK